MFTLLFSTASAGDSDLERLARAWFTDMPAAAVPEYWDDLARALPLSADLMRREMPPPWETQTSSGRPFASVAVAPRPWRSPRASVYDPRRFESVLKRVGDPGRRPIHIALWLGMLDTDDVPIAGGDLIAGLDTSEDDPALATFSLYREESRPGVSLFPDAVLDRCVTYLKELCRAEDLDFAGAGDAAYGGHRTFLDTGLRRDPDDSVRDARRHLRGYAWVTVVPPELAARLGGADALAATGTFHEVEALPNGGVWLRATERIDAYDAAAVHRVFHALAPVLPPGRPELTDPNPYAWQLVEEDAAAHR